MLNRKVIQKTYQIILLIFTCYCILSCSLQRIQITPASLPVAFLNKPYAAEIHISDSLINESFRSEISNDSFKLLPEQRIDGNNIHGQPNIRYDYGKLKLIGTPTNLTPIKITLKGSVYGSMFSSKKNFIKEYTLEVKEK